MHWKRLLERLRDYPRRDLMESSGYKVAGCGKQMDGAFCGAEVQPPLGWVAVKNRDSLVPQEESDGQSD